MHAQYTELREVFFALCKSVDTPFSLSCWLRFKADPKSIADVAIDARNYSCAADFSQDYLVASFLKKFKFSGSKSELKKVALQTFATSEELCRQTNVRIRKGASEGFPPHVERLFWSIRRKISALLGPFDIVAVNAACKWGPGATRGIPRRMSTRDYKHSTLPFESTHGALGLIRAHIESDPHWFAALTDVMPDGPFSLLPCCFKVVEDNRVDTVPKNAKTDRIIAKEPAANAFLQQGVGRFIRRRLLRWGVDLDDQGYNQNWASLAHGLDLATLDLSAASDSLCRELVFQFLPLDWALYLDRLRSPKGMLPDGSVIKYEKFSSMGNAFTFELETLIFHAISTAVRDELLPHGVVATYGDDMIIPSCCAPLTIELLEYCGFKVNTEKSFISGRFYESCGKHYFDGVDVTPVFQKSALTSTAEWIRLGNRLIRWAERSGFNVVFDPVVRNAWLAARRLAKNQSKHALSFFVPQGYEGDDGWLLPSEEYHGLVNLASQHGWRCRVLRPKFRRKQAHQAAAYGLSLRTLGSSDDVAVFVDSAILSGRLGQNGACLAPPNLTAIDAGFNREESGHKAGWAWIIPQRHVGLSW